MPKALVTVDHPSQVFIRDGEVFANSMDVARTFKKQHGHVLRDIDRLLEEGLSNFGETPRIDPQNGCEYRTYDVDRDGFSLLCMGFTGTKALKWKMDFIRAFNAMEAQLVVAPTTVSTVPHIDLDDPAYMIALSSSLFARNQELQAWKQAAKPAVEFAERVSASSATYCLTDACKLLELKPKAGMQAMADAGLIYRRTPGAPWVASQAALDKHWFKPVIVERDAFTGSQTRVTGAGLVAIAGKIGATLTQLEIHNRLTALSRQPDLLTAA